MADEINTSAEALEAAALPRLHEVHADPGRACAGPADLPQAMQNPVEAKSPAKWAYERLGFYVRKFEETLDNEHEIAMGFAGGQTGVLRIEGMGYFDPDIVTFYGVDSEGARTQLVQHVSQLSVMLRALPKQADAPAPRRIGFRLAAEMATPEPQDEA